MVSLCWAKPLLTSVHESADSVYLGQVYTRGSVCEEGLQIGQEYTPTARRALALAGWWHQYARGYVVLLSEAARESRSGIESTEWLSVHTRSLGFRHGPVVEICPGSMARCRAELRQETEGSLVKLYRREILSGAVRHFFSRSEADPH